MPTLLEGKKVAEHTYQNLLLELSLLPCVPKIVFILVGSDPASQTYVRSKNKKCLDLGIRGETLELPENTSEADLLSRIRAFNDDKDVHGLLVQLPLPAHIRKSAIINAIDPLKDVDGLTYENAGRLFQGDPRLLPCTPAGMMEMLKFYSIGVEGKNVVVVGRSEIVGKPIAQLMLMQNATVTICHSRTKNLAAETSRADILVAAVGKKHFITSGMVKKGSVILDVGIHRTPDGITGDVDFASVAGEVDAISPVPGGVGPMTIAMLMKNVALAAKLQTGKSP